MKFGNSSGTKGCTEGIFQSNQPNQSDRFLTGNRHWHDFDHTGAAKSILQLTTRIKCALMMIFIQCQLQEHDVDVFCFFNPLRRWHRGLSEAATSRLVWLEECWAAQPLSVAIFEPMRKYAMAVTSETVEFYLLLIVHLPQSLK